MVTLRTSFMLIFYHMPHLIWVHLQNYRNWGKPRTNLKKIRQIKINLDSDRLIEARTTGYGEKQCSTTHKTKFNDFYCSVASYNISIWCDRPWIYNNQCTWLLSNRIFLNHRRFSQILNPRVNFLTWTWSMIGEFFERKTQFKTINRMDSFELWMSVTA